MFSGGQDITNNNSHRQPSQSNRVRCGRSDYQVKIVEQPASKALRFRYLCEGRSAGSIPGASSTQENKTYPAIKVVGKPAKKAVVVVSCVTKDAPHKPHPHNLVGREGCKKGVCTMEIPAETMSVTFTNLGIQCVKKKDIESALREREELRVDPFRTGFSHRNQPTSIDLNIVRLCFQVFLVEDGKNVPLAPVVSEPIYDKKSMNDLSIIKLSDCVSYVDGGRKDIILLCEKVAKEDIQVRFYEEVGGQIVWEALADIQPAQVHKQHAIWFKTPRYKTLDVTEAVNVHLQLRRPSDGATSESRPFQLLPLDSGRPTYWTYRRHMAKKGNFSLLNSILAESRKMEKNKINENNAVFNNNNNVVNDDIDISDKDESIMFVDNSTNMDSLTTNTNLSEATVTDPWGDYSEVQKVKDTMQITNNNNNNNNEEKSFNELINQVAELDEIYADTQARLLNQDLTNVAKPILSQIPQNESFDDAKTYSSLQLAFKNPVELEINKQYEIASIDKHMPPPIPNSIISTNNNNNNKRENNEEKLPPLPPKRSKKIETYIGGSLTSIALTGKQAENVLHRSNSSIKAVPISRSNSFNLQRPKSQVHVFPNANKQLPPTPNYSTLPNPKKRGFFSKLFGKKSKTPAASRDSSVTPTTKRNSFSTSFKSLQVEPNLGKSSGNISTHSTNSVRIPLKDDSPTNSTKKLNPPTKDLSTINMDDIDMNLDLTEAEHYALYTTLAPHATQSEFDEMSCYYAPVEGGKLLTNSEVMARLSSKT
ncbi:unnamed protein product [Brassicogethes aeneus]|uniref:RHD domain-containing protein n=1 Tax=Brassicogethes aeneus TaxID=1431903 RepID=A0A9P0BCT8_BRAAE|nr:unnamed protein product [Brassicogethes aeneus]